MTGVQTCALPIFLHFFDGFRTSHEIQKIELIDEAALTAMLDRERIEAFCRERGIALYDTAVEVIRLKDNASDASLQVVREVDLETLLARIPACRAVVTTGQKATDTLRAITGCGEPAVRECVPMPFAGRDLTLWRMPSSSRAFPRPVEWKAEFYRKVFSENGIL